MLVIKLSQIYTRSCTHTAHCTICSTPSLCPVGEALGIVGMVCVLDTRPFFSYVTVVVYIYSAQLLHKHVCTMNNEFKFGMSYQTMSSCPLHSLREAAVKRSHILLGQRNACYYIAPQEIKLMLAIYNTHIYRGKRCTIPTFTEGIKPCYSSLQLLYSYAIVFELFSHPECTMHGWV